MPLHISWYTIYAISWYVTQAYIVLLVLAHIVTQSGVKGLPKICCRKSDLQIFWVKTLLCGLIVHHYTVRGPSLCLCLYLCNCICICFHICICTAQPPCSVAPWWSGLSALALDQFLIVWLHHVIHVRGSLTWFHWIYARVCVCVSMCLFVCVSVCLCVCLSMSLCVCVSVCLCVCECLFCMWGEVGTWVLLAMQLELDLSPLSLILRNHSSHCGILHTFLHFNSTSARKEAQMIHKSK